MAPGHDITVSGITNESASTSTVAGAGQAADDDLQVSPHTIEWPLWVQLVAPLISVLLFIIVNGILLLTHKAPSVANEGVPLSGMPDSEAQRCGRKASKGATYGSTATQSGDHLCVADNMAMTISMEETSLSKAIEPKATPGSSNSGPPYHTLNNDSVSAAPLSFEACAGACTSKSTEPLVHHAVNMSDNGSNGHTSAGPHKNGGKRTKSSTKSR